MGPLLPDDDRQKQIDDAVNAVLNASKGNVSPDELGKIAEQHFPGSGEYFSNQLRSLEIKPVERPDLVPAETAPLPDIRPHGNLHYIEGDDGKRTFFSSKADAEQFARGDTTDVSEQSQSNKHIDKVIEAVKGRLQWAKDNGISADDLHRMVFEQLGTRIPRMLKESGGSTSSGGAGIKMATEVGRDTEGIKNHIVNGIIEGAKRTGDSWNKALDLLNKGYEVTDPEVLKYAFDIATNMLPGGIAIKEGVRLLGGSSKSPPGSFYKDPQTGLPALDIGKPAKQAEQAATPQLIGKGQQLLDDAEQHFKDGLITAEELANKKKLINQQYDMGGEGYVGGGNKPTQTPYDTPTMYNDPTNHMGQWVVEYQGSTVNFNTMEGAEKHLALVEKQEGVTGKKIIPTSPEDALLKIQKDSHDKAKALMSDDEYKALFLGEGPLAMKPEDAFNALSSEAKAHVSKYNDATEKIMAGQSSKLSAKPLEEDMIKYGLSIQQKGGFYHIYDKSGGTGLSFANEENAKKMVKSYIDMYKSHEKLQAAAAKTLNVPPIDQAMVKLRADQNLAKQQVHEYLAKDPSNNRWYEDVHVASTIGTGYNQKTNLGLFLTNNARDRRELVRAVMNAHEQGIGKVYYHDPSNNSFWIVDLRPPNMRTEPFSKLEKQFPDATRVDTIDHDPLTPHPGPLLAYHGTGQKFEAKPTKKGRAELEFADPPGKSSDIGWHFGTAEQASHMAMNKSYHTAGEGGKVIPAYVNVKNPFSMSDMGGWPPDGMVKNMIMHLEDRNFYAKTDKTNLDKQIASLKGLQLKMPDPYNPDGLQKGYEMIRKWLDKNGYDGIRYLNEAEGEGWSYIVWKKGQVKSAGTPDHTLYVAPGFPKYDPRQEGDAVTQTGGSDKKPGELRMPTLKGTAAGLKGVFDKAIDSFMPLSGIITPEERSEMWRIYQAGGLKRVNAYLAVLIDKRNRGSIPDTDEAN